MKIPTAFLCSKQGKRGRQEDCAGMEHPFYVLSDGMGGHDDGDVAAHLVCDVLTDADGAGYLLERAREANRLLREQRSARRTNMDATLTAVHLAGRTASFVHAGDSRLYVVSSQGKLTQVSEDHSVADDAYRSGKWDLDTYARVRETSVGRALTRYAGMHPFDPQTGELQLGEGSMLLMTSDGIHEVLDKEEMEDIFRGGFTKTTTVGLLVDCAIAKGSTDNCTALLIVLP